MKKGKFIITSLILIFSLVLNIIPATLDVFANTPNVEIKVDVAPDSSNITSGDNVTVMVSYKILNYSVKKGDKISIEIPKILSDVYPEFPQKHFETIENPVEGQDSVTYTAIFGNQIETALQGYIEISAKASEVKELTNGKININLQDVAASTDFVVKPKPEAPKPDPKPPEKIDRYLAKWADKSYITNPTEGKIIRYYIYINEKYDEIDNAILKDILPEGVSVLNDSIVIYKVSEDGQRQDVTNDVPKLIKDEKIEIDFGKINSKYEVYYTGEITKSLPTYVNQATLYNGTIELQTGSAKVDSKDNNTMIKKSGAIYSNSGRKLEYVKKIGDKINYAIDINPNHIQMNNAVVKDYVPDGMSIIPESVVIKKRDLKENWSVVTDSFKDKLDISDGNITFNIGKDNGFYRLYYSLNVDKIKEEYINNAIITDDTLNQSSSFTSKFQTGAGAMNAWKEVDKKTLTKNENQLVTYQIVFDSEGFFKKDSVNIIDEVNPKVKIINVEPSTQFSVNIDKDKNTINIVNDKSGIKYGEKATIKIVTDFSNVDEGTTVRNVAKIKIDEDEISTKPADTQKGYRFIGKKVDLIDNSKPLKGAKFNLLDSSKNTIKTIETDENGIIMSPVDKPGDFYLKEIEAPDGYKVDKNEFKFTINENDIGTTVDIGNIVNERLNHNINIVDIDSDNKNKILYESEFNILDNEGNIVGKITTNKGEGSLLLPPGKYTIIQTKAPEGYLLNNEPKVFEINVGKNSDVNLQIENKIIKGNLEFIKVEANNPTKVLQGAEFAIFNKSKKEIAKATTNENGKAIFNNISYGNYYYREIKAPIGYAIDSNFYDFKIENNEEILTKTVSNKIQEKYPSGGASSNSSSGETNKPTVDENKTPGGEVNKPTVDENKTPGGEVNKPTVDENKTPGGEVNKSKVDENKTPGGEVQKPSVDENKTLDGEINKPELDENKTSNNKNNVIVKDITKDKNSTQNNTKKSNNQSKESVKGKSNNPKTYDDGILFYIILFVLSIIGIIITNISRKNKIN